MSRFGTPKGYLLLPGVIPSGLSRTRDLLLLVLT